jgi:hypothetical protein
MMKVVRIHVPRCPIGSRRTVDLKPIQERTMQTSTITPNTIDTAVTRMAYLEVMQLTDMLAAAERRLRQARAALTEMCPEPADLARAGSVSVPTVLLGALAAMDADLLTTIAHVERTLRRYRNAT